MKNDQMPDAIREFGHQMELLENLASAAPQTLLIEGGSESARFGFALHWAKLFNCAKIFGAGLHKPCLCCAVCHQIDALEYFDLLVYDGRISNKMDEENPGPIKSLRKANIDKLKQILGTEPRGSGKRIVIFSGMSQTREEAMNSLLKILEEPAKDTFFVLLAPHREQILPTLVSRSHCLTLAWIHKNLQNKELEQEAAAFIHNGRGFLDKISAKGAVDAQTAASLILACQQALLDVHAPGELPGNALAKSFLPFSKDPQKGFMVSQWLIEAQEMLVQTVAPQRVLESLFCKLFLLSKDGLN